MPPCTSRSSRPAAPASIASARARSAAAGRARAHCRSSRRLAPVLLLLCFRPRHLGLLPHACGQRSAAPVARAPACRGRARRPGHAAGPAPPATSSCTARANSPSDLGLEVDGQYTSYAAWPGDRVVTALVATRPGEVEPAGFWFPILGRLPYKGYFDPEKAGAEAARLRARGLDVCEVPVRAYSTLGWFDDPVTGPMLRSGDGRLVETILHELVHSTVYVRGHVDFDEGVASFIGEEASVRFYAQAGDPEQAARRRAGVEEGHRLDAHILASAAARAGAL